MEPIGVGLVFVHPQNAGTRVSHELRCERLEQRFRLGREKQRQSFASDEDKNGGNRKNDQNAAEADDRARQAIGHLDLAQGLLRLKPPTPQSGWRGGGLRRWGLAHAACVIRVL
jgi:hypothetical protein